MAVSYMQHRVSLHFPNCHDSKLDLSFQMYESGSSMKTTWRFLSDSEWEAVLCCVLSALFMPGPHSSCPSLNFQWDRKIMDFYQHQRIWLKLVPIAVFWKWPLRPILVHVMVSRHTMGLFYVTRKRCILLCPMFPFVYFNLHLFSRK